MQTTYCTALPTDTPPDHSSESLIAYRSLVILNISLREVSVKEKEALCPPPVQVVWQNFLFYLGLIINSADTREMWTQSNKEIRPQNSPLCATIGPTIATILSYNEPCVSAVLGAGSDWTWDQPSWVWQLASIHGPGTYGPFANFLGTLFLFKLFQHSVLIPFCTSHDLCLPAWLLVR